MRRPIRDHIARKMWAIWQNSDNPTVNRNGVPYEFYEMAQIAMNETKNEFIEMLNDTIRQRLEKLYE